MAAKIYDKIPIVDTARRCGLCLLYTSAKAPVEAPAENPIAAAFEQKTAENTKKGLLEKPPVFYHKGVKEEIDDPSMTCLLYTS